jgi:uncharacterized RDD family membrane protein YckC
MILLSPVLGMLGMNLASGEFDFASMSQGDVVEMVTTFVKAAVLGSIVMRVVDVFYHSLMETSKFQGSVGKIALGLKVTDKNGAKLTFVTAFLRNLGKIVSGMILFICYIMAGFTDKKQALHDMFVGTLVVKKK